MQTKGLGLEFYADSQQTTLWTNGFGRTRENHSRTSQRRVWGLSRHAQLVRKGRLQGVISRISKPGRRRQLDLATPRVSRPIIRNFQCDGMISVAQLTSLTCVCASSFLCSGTMYRVKSTRCRFSTV